MTLPLLEEKEQLSKVNVKGGEINSIGLRVPRVSWQCPSLVGVWSVVPSLVLDVGFGSLWLPSLGWGGLLFFE